MQQHREIQHDLSGSTAAAHGNFAALQSLTFQRLFQQHGPLVDIDNTWRLLSFKSRDSFNRAVNQHRVPLKVIRPTGRKQSFVATAELASYLAALASPEEEAIS